MKNGGINGFSNINGSSWSILKNDVGEITKFDEINGCIKLIGVDALRPLPGYKTEDSYIYTTIMCKYRILIGTRSLAIYIENGPPNKAQINKGFILTTGLFWSKEKYFEKEMMTSCDETKTPGECGFIDINYGSK